MACTARHAILSKSNFREMIHSLTAPITPKRFGQCGRWASFDSIYRQVSNIRRTKSPHLKDSRTVLRLSLPNPLKPGVKMRMMM